MKKLVLAALLTSFTFGASAAEKINFGVSATYPPFESIGANNEIVGFDIDLAKALCKQMQAECTFTNHAFDSLIPSLKFRKYDAVISGMDITPERSKQVSFTTPYYENSAVVIAKKDTYKTFADLKGKRIGMENGTTHQKYIQDQHPEVKTVSYDSYQNAFIDLKNGRIDGVFGDTAVVNEWLKTNPQLGVATEKVTDPQYFGTGLGIAVRPDNKALLEKLNNALAAIKADGTYQSMTSGSHSKIQKAAPAAFLLLHQQRQHFIVRGVREHIKKLYPFDAITRQFADIFRHSLGVTAGVDNKTRCHR
jgi:arginine transport system substrate-binding protein